jgi:hypothetical protein
MGQTALLPLRSMKCYGFVSPLKIHRPLPGLNPRALDKIADTLNTRPPRATRHTVTFLEARDSQVFRNVENQHKATRCYSPILESMLATSRCSSTKNWVKRCFPRVKRPKREADRSLHRAARLGACSLGVASALESIGAWL